MNGDVNGTTRLDLNAGAPGPRGGHTASERPAHALRAGCRVLAGVGVVCGASSAALAEVTQDQAFDSIRQNMGQPVDLSNLGWVAAGLLTVVGLLVYLGHRRKVQRSGKALNHKGKLIRELTRAVGLKPAELKKVRGMAEQLRDHHEIEVDNPMLLLLCPSLLAKAMKKKE
jgi:hypothetical protein